MATQMTIVGGPSKFDLILSLFDGDCCHRRLMKFSIVDGTKGRLPEHEFIINKIEREDGSGEKWMLSGTCTSPVSGQHKNMHAYYCTSDRHGWIKLGD